MDHIVDIFEARGFIEQVTDWDGVHIQLKRPTTGYIGFDPTGSSLHVGNLIPIMSLAHLQRAGHRPIAVVGGGTALVGDPSGKTEMRPILTREEIDRNAEGIKKQLSRFIDFSNDQALMVNNADWLVELNYIEFLRDIGRHFSVNRMLAAESYRSRLETGLNFIEFNYMLLQAYDFWYLFKHYDCRLQMGGNDQWGNILAGADLTRRLAGEIIHGITFPLITTSTGIKMGKTHQGAVWLDPELTSPYDYYQYWVNQDDQDIISFLKLFSFLPMEEINRLAELKGEEVREAKEILAFEATKICHGQEEAVKARNSAKQLFGGQREAFGDSVPSFNMETGEVEQGIPAFILFEKTNLCKTRSEARRLISQGGGYVNDRRLDQFDEIIDSKDVINESILLRAGKKRYLRVVID